MIPSLYATSVATVDLPVPVAPPIEQDDRQVELAECIMAAQPSNDLGSLVLAENLLRKLAEPIEIDRLGAARDEIRLDAQRKLVGTHGRNTRRHQRPSHQPLRVRQPVPAEGQRVGMARLGHIRGFSPSFAATANSANSSRASSKPGAITSLPASTTSTPRSAAVSATRSIAAAFTSTTYTSASRVSSSRRSSSRSARFCELNTTPSRWSTGAGARGEDGRAAAGERLDRLQTKIEPDRATVERRRRGRHYVAHRQDEIADERAIRVQPAGEIVRDQDARVGGDRRDRGAASVENDHLGFEGGCQAGALEHVRGERRAGESTAAAAAAHRRHPGENRGLEVVRGSMPTGSRPRQQAFECRRDLDHLGLGRPAATHRDDDDRPVAGEYAREVARHRRLPHALARPDHGKRRERKRLERRRIEPEVGTHVRDARRERPAGKEQALAGPENGLVREVDDDLRPERRQSLLEALGERHAVVVAPAQLLGPADEQRGDERVRKLDQRVADDGRVVLSVDDRECAGQPRDESSPSIRAVYFSNSSVSVENWMIRSCPWKGYRRQTETWAPSISITL